MEIKVHISKKLKVKKAQKLKVKKVIINHVTQI